MTTQSLMNEQAQIDQSASRLVWVLNRDIKPYKGTYRTEKISIPPNMEKIPKRTKDGGNLMPYLEARHFICDLKEAQEWLPDAMGRPQPVFGIKALIDQELTPMEYAKYVGKTATQIAQENEKVEKKAKRDLNKALKAPRLIK